MNTIISEQSDQGEVAYDVFSKLTEERIIFLSDFIDDENATDIVATLLYLDHLDDQKKISLYINVNGGDVRSVLMIYDIMKLVKCPIETVCIGAAFDESLLLLAAGTKGMRLATKSAKMSINNISSEHPRHANLITARIIMNQISKDNSQLLQSLSKCTGKSLSVITKDAEKKKYFNSIDAKKYGIIDNIIQGNK